MAYDPDKIFGEIRKLLENASIGDNPSRTEICQRLVDDGVVRSMGTAHKYVGAFFAADSIKAEIVAPDIDTSVLPERVYSAFVSLLESASRLKNEVGAALEDLTQRSSTSFGKMMTAHDLAQQAEIVELATELETMRADRETTRDQLLAEQARSEELNATIAEKDGALAAARTVESDLRNLVADQEAKIAAQMEAAGSRDRLISALESERALRERQTEKADEEIRQLREMLGPPGNELKASSRANPGPLQGAIVNSEGSPVDLVRPLPEEGDCIDLDIDLPTKSPFHLPQ